MQRKNTSPVIPTETVTFPAAKMKLTLAVTEKLMVILLEKKQSITMALTEA